MLRGINLGPARRVPMAELRALLTDAGYDEVATHGQSGNVVLRVENGTEADADQIAADVARRVAERFGFVVPVSARTGAELSTVLARDPIPEAARDPKRYQVTFLPAEPAAEQVARLHGLVAGSERLAVHGRELYSAHPGGIARSKLAAALTAPALGVSATVRNWTTVTRLAELAGR